MHRASKLPKAHAASWSDVQITKTSFFQIRKGSRLFILDTHQHICKSSTPACFFDILLDDACTSYLVWVCFWLILTLSEKVSSVYSSLTVLAIPTTAAACPDNTCTYDPGLLPQRRQVNSHCSCRYSALLLLALLLILKQRCWRYD